jgi:uncharacterized peroxidase-related enzyme
MLPPEMILKNLTMPALMRYKTSTGSILSSLAHTLLKGPSGLSHTDREMIAAYVSSLNECEYCFNSHASKVNDHLNDEGKTMTCIVENIAGSPVTEKMKSLLNIAKKVQQSGKLVTKDDIETARKNGASDEDIHDTVIISAAFCMYNRYIDGLSKNSSLINQLPEMRANS